ncbi:MAG: polysaccharide biosynthesis protein [Deltaproteobacteria bacterium]|nr:polysaccharide biosynthesis protein [Deltaproteobacteria bacterium]
MSTAKSKKPIRVLIVGAGDAGRMVAHEMKRHAEAGFVPIAFIDDDPVKLGSSVEGVPVLGDRKKIHNVVCDHAVDEILIALPSADGSAIRGIIRYCENERLKFRIVPGIWEIIRGEVEIKQIRPIRAEDLLGRETVELDLSLLTQAYAGKRLLVTGAGGSIGSEICRQVLLADPDKLIIMGRGENSIFEAQSSFREYLKNTKVIPVIGDVRDTRAVEEVLERDKPQVIFHAAAHKHVGFMEQNPVEAVANNFLATAALVETAIRHNVERLVLISTDKAVNPRAVFGVTKRMAELYLLQRARQLADTSSTRLIVVRFGNVLGSRGSVVPIFQRQIAQGGPVTVSHPEVARYFMTIKEATLLVVKAAAVGKGGEIFVLDMGDQMLIAELARNLIVLSGYVPDVDIPIVYGTLKQGEKLREELVHEFEPLEKTELDGLHFTRGMSATQPSVTGEAVQRLSELVRAGDNAGVRAEIQRLVPEAVLTPVNS